MNAVDETLLLRWMENRDAEAFAEIVRSHSAMVYATCKRILGNAADAEEVTQECFLKLAEAHTPVRSSLTGWLHVLATHRALNRIKADSTRRAREIRYTADLRPAATARWDDIIGFVDEAIAALPEKLRYPVIAHFLEGRTQGEVAKSRGVSQATASRFIQRGIQEIRTSLKRRGVAVNASGLVSLLAANAVEAAPANLAPALGKIALAGTVNGPIAAESNLLLKGVIAMIAKNPVMSLGVFAIGVLTVFMAMNISFEGNALETPPNVAAVPVIDEIASSAFVPPSGDQSVEAPVVLAQAVPEDEENLAVESENESDETIAEETASISGTVLDEDAYPIAGAQVWLFEHDKIEGPVPRFDTSVTTGADGRFVLSGIMTGGQIVFSADTKDHVMQSRLIVDVEAGDTLTDIDIILAPASHFVKGIVVTEDGAVVPAAEVSVIIIREPVSQRLLLYNSWSTWVLFDVTDSNGQFEIALPHPGICTFVVHKEGHAEGRFLNIETGTEDARFVLPGFGAIEGRVINSDGSPLVGTVVAVTHKSDYVPDSAAGNSQVLFYSIQRGVTDADGHYRVEALSPHVSYSLSVFDKPESEVRQNWHQWMQGGNSDTLRTQAVAKGLHVDAGAVLSGVDFEIAENSIVRIRGHMIDETSGRPIDGLTIGCFTEAGRVNLGFSYLEETGDVGAYYIEFSLKEETEINFRANYYSGDTNSGGGSVGPFKHAEDRRPLQPITVSPGDELTLDFLVKGPVSIPVRVVDTAGNAVPGAGVGIGRVMGDGSWAYRSGIGWPTDEFGQILQRGLSPDFTYFVWAQKTPGASGLFLLPLAQYGPIQGGPNETVSEIVLVIANKGGIEGVFVDADGNPLANVPIVLTAPTLDGVGLQTVHVQTDSADGHIIMLNALLPAFYPEITFSATINGTQFQARFEDIEVIEDAIVDLGVIALQAVPEDSGGAASDEE